MAHTMPASFKRHEFTKKASNGGRMPIHDGHDKSGHKEPDHHSHGKTFAESKASGHKPVAMG